MSVTDIADRLVSARQKAGFHSVAEAARSIDGVSTSALRQYEWAHRAPSSLGLLAIARAYGVTCDWLLTGYSPRTKARKAASR